MPRCIAFLRAINVGGHVVKMERLRECFETAGFQNVETFIASGNVIFETREKPGAGLEAKIEGQLLKLLGYETATFVRTPAEVAAIAANQPFPETAAASALAFNIGLLAEPLSEEAVKKLMAFRTEVDDFHTSGREIYWLCQARQSDSKFTNAGFERALKVRATFRNRNTFARLAAKYHR